MNIKDKIIFAKTRYSYDSYIDFWRVVRFSGFQECYVDQIDLSADKVFITTPVNGEIGPHVKHRRSILKGPQKAKIVWWNIERPDAPGSSLFSNVVDNALKTFNSVWVADKYFQSYDKRMKLVNINSHYRLNPGHTVYYPKRFDFVHMGYVCHRRRDIFNKLKSIGITCADPDKGSIGWGPDREKAIAQSKIMLNVHQTPAPISEPIRMMVAAAFRIPFITETLQDVYPLKPGVHFAHASYEEIVNAVSSIVRGSGLKRLKDIGDNLHKELCIDRPFEKPVIEAVQEQFG